MPGTEQEPVEPQPRIPVTNLESENLGLSSDNCVWPFFPYGETFAAHFRFCSHLLRRSDHDKHVCLALGPFDFFYSSEAFVQLFLNHGFL